MKGLLFALASKRDGKFMGQENMSDMALHWRDSDVASLGPDSPDASFYRTLIRSTATEKNKKKKKRRNAVVDAGVEAEGSGSGKGMFLYAFFSESVSNIFQMITENARPRRVSMILKRKMSCRSMVSLFITAGPH